MSRKIKFRAWRKELGVQIVQCIDFTGHEIRNGIPSYTTNSNDGWYDLDGAALMQFTGLTDKNGVEIYEQDLLQNESGRICVVKWHKYAAMFDCEPVVIVKDDNCDGFKSNYWSRLIIKIGNIYSNPELLKRKA